MTNWIKDTTFLRGYDVDLLPLDRKHFSELEKLSKDKRIWEYYIFDGTDSEKFLETLDFGIAEREKGNQFPFVIYHKSQKKIIGSTRFLDIQPIHKKLEIGWTWLQPEYWSTEINLECKLFFLNFALKICRLCGFS
ncbi:MAG: GNAT family N-acetyltransferase [Bacteroidota bacterium]|nr:GNAT family N-acetyltransferase [Bacteroidota bacterium]